MLTEPVPARLDVVSVKPSQGSMLGEANGDLPASGRSRQARPRPSIVRVIPTRTGVITNTASADSHEAEPVVDNATVRVTAPTTTLR